MNEKFKDDSKVTEDDLPKITSQVYVMNLYQKAHPDINMSKQKEFLNNVQTYITGVLNNRNKIQV
jgi:hypothetical protein